MKSKQFNYQKGKYGEDKARTFLEENGYKLIEANYTNKIGEIDLIMSDNDWLVFVEVKYKLDDRFGIPEEMISSNKLFQIRRVADAYLTINRQIRQQFKKYRIDAVCILGEKIKHYKNVP